MLYFITGSKNKFEEVKAVLPQVEQLVIDLPEIQEVDAHEIIKAKLAEATKHHGGEFIVEDTSLYFAGLNGLPGPLIKWFMKTIGNDGLADLAEKLGNNKAVAKTILGYSNGKGEIKFFEGEVVGQIVKLAGDTNFGWDPIFMPDGYNQTFAIMTPEEKNKISMRRLAADKLAEYLSANS